jgi:meso-butanediol dehydrogenase/(S,S)-butanediol dehydrogenase/diacetyl reductase
MSAAIVTHADAGAGPAIVSRLTEDGFAVTAISSATSSARHEIGRKVAASCENTDTGLLVNNLPDFPHGPIVDTSVAAFAAGLDAGLNSVFSACREAAASAVKRGGALNIINVVSTLGIVGLEARSAEACSSAGVLAATKALAAEWGPTGIRVTPVVAGPTADWAETPGDLAGVIPLGRFVTSEEIAAAVSFLAGSDASGITGSALTIDGGWLAYGYREDTP